VVCRVVRGSAMWIPKILISLFDFTFSLGQLQSARIG
jgi:hypothetical protein